MAKFTYVQRGGTIQYINIDQITTILVPDADTSTSVEGTTSDSKFTIYLNGNQTIRLDKGIYWNNLHAKLFPELYLSTKELMTETKTMTKSKGETRTMTESKGETCLEACECNICMNIKLANSLKCKTKYPTESDDWNSLHEME
jgi:hypothetical protein